jgi:hypothetical protein
LKPPTTLSTPSRTVAETLVELQRPVDPRHFRQLSKGGTTLSYLPWHCVARHLNHRVPGWQWLVRSVQELGGSVVVHGSLLVPADGGTLRFDGVASEPLKGGSFAPPAEVAESAALRRAASKSGLGLELYED